MKTSYIPKFLSWCGSYDQEVQEMEDLLDSEPSDIKQLKQEYEILTGNQYRRKWGVKKYPSFDELEETKEEQSIRRNK